MYRLDDTTKQLIKVDMDDKAQVTEWSIWMENVENTRLARTEIANLLVSTVFLGIDHNTGYSDEPILFETIIFDTDMALEYGGYKDVYMQRYATYNLAMMHHEFIIAKLEGMLGYDNHLEIE